MQEVRDFLAEMLIWLCLAGLGGLVVAATWIVRPDVLRKILPPQRQRAVPWTGFEVVGAFFLAFFYMPAVAHELVTASGVLPRVYGADFHVDASFNDPDPVKRLDYARRTLWETAFAFPLQIPLTIALLRWARGTYLYQLGLSGSRAAKNALLGWTTWLALSPGVLALNLLVILVYKLWRAGATDIHPLDQLSKGSAGDNVLMFFLAVLAAPVVEELLFRGILQPWATRRSWAPDTLLVAAFAMALFLRYDKVNQAFHASSGAERLSAAIDGFSPALFILAMIPGYILIEGVAWRWIPSPHVARAVYGSSLLFASFHSAVWPSPIPLFPLSLGLGFLAYRTQSLIGPIVLHALFNTISAIALLLSQPASEPPPANGLRETPAFSPRAGYITFSAASWRDGPRP